MSREPKVIRVSEPFECPFNVGFACMLDENIEDQLLCEDDVPHNCPLITQDYTVKLVRDRTVK